MSKQISILNFAAHTTNVPVDTTTTDSRADITGAVNTLPVLTEVTQNVSSSSSKRTPARKFNKSWMATRGWLTFENSVMRCRLCQKYAKKGSTSFQNGSSTFKLETIVKHELSDTHKSSVSASKASQLLAENLTPILKGLQAMSANELKLHEKQFRTAFYIAKMGKPLSDFKPLCELQSANFDCNYLTKHYCSNNQCKTFVGYISEVYKTQVREMLVDSEFFSLITDGSTDVGVVEEEVMYARLLDKNCEPTVKFIAIKHVEKADAPGLVSVVIDALENDMKFENWKECLVTCCCDGASVNLGKNKGVVALVTKNYVPHLTGMHCTAHRLELALKDAAKTVPMMDTIDEFLNSLYKTYDNSSLNWEGLKETSKALNINILKPVNVQGTWWIQHRDRAVAAVMRGYPAIAEHLHQVSLTDKGEKGAKCKGLRKLLVSPKFLLFLFGLQFYLVTCSALSQIMQDNDSTLENLESKLSKTVHKLETYNVEKQLSCAAKNDIQDKSEYRGIQLEQARGEGSLQATITKVATDIKKLINETLSSIKQRFDTGPDRFLKNFKIFSPKHWPCDQDKLSDYGCDEIQTLLDKYQVLLETKGYDSSKVLMEWNTLLVELSTLYGNTKLEEMSSLELWPKVLRDKELATEYRNILALVKISLVIPVSSAEAERGFSWMNRVKTDHRSKLGSTVLCDLMHICMSNEDIVLFDPKPAVLRWWKGGKKRHLRERYGSRKRRKDTIDKNNVGVLLYSDDSEDAESESDDN